MNKKRTDFLEGLCFNSQYYWRSGRFWGRILNEKLKGVKYLNSDSSIYIKKVKFYMVCILQNMLLKKLDFCYVVEGYTDVMALHQFGIENVVSSCGTALTKEQIRLIHRFTNNIVILFDSDTQVLMPLLRQ